MSGRAKRVLVYTTTLLIAPMPVMPFAKGTREFAWSLVACGAILSAGSYYAALGEMQLRFRGLLGNKILASSLITLLFGMAMLFGSLVYLT
jgi:hypothetical protein